MTYSLGVDIGSVNAKIVLVDGNLSIIHSDIERITSGPSTAVKSLINKLSDKFDIGQISGAGVSGAGKTAIPDEMGWSSYSSSLSIASGVLHKHPDAKTIIQIGGQSSIIIVLEDGLKKPWQVVSNPLCAAGTGRFIEQQAYRLGISIDEFSNLALKCDGSPPRIAARCSVFAKTDLIHLQQKGVQIEAMLYALCESIARMVASLKKGSFKEPVFFVGGVAANKAALKALNETLPSENEHQIQVNVPQDFLYIEALGSALLSAGKQVKSLILPESDIRQHYFTMPKLEAIPDQTIKTSQEIETKCTGYLGIDVGSTSTKAVILDESGKNVLAKHYLMTAGKPINAVQEVFNNLLKYGADKVKIAGVGVTGSGRYLIGSVVGADVIKNEITAQARAASEIDAEADIIEIGGQDSKLVIKRNGVVVDYQMNKACAAGTGSFIDELAEMLNISVKNGDFANMAFEAPYTIDLGTRCAAFMGQAVASAQQEGIPIGVITASLANSIAKNYLSKVVGTKKLGNRVLLTGAVFYNRAVVSAFNEQLKGKTLTVPEHKEISGAIGVALLAKEDITGQESKFRGFKEVIESNYSLSTFICKKCDNNCTITRMQMPDKEQTFYGSRCDRYDNAISKGKIETFFDEREKLLFRDYKELSGTGPTVGIPRALLVYDYAPLLIGYLNALGVKVTLTSQTTNHIVGKAVELSYTDSCFPLKILHGHVAELRDVDYILYPCAIRLGEKDGDENQKYSCPLVQASPFIVRQVLDLKEKLLIPILDFSRGNADVIRNLTDTAAGMGFNRATGRKAAIAGITAQQQFEKDKADIGRKLLKQVHESNKLGVVLFSRSYMSQDSGANLGIAEKLAQLGVIPIPLDFLPLDSISPKKYSDRPYWFYESKHIAGAAITKEDKKLYGLVISNFGCGPNSFILNILNDIMDSKPLGQLEIDEHAAEAGIVTRLEAFIDTINNHARVSQQIEASNKDIYRGTTALINTNKTILIPRMSPHAEVVGAAMESCGARIIVLPEPNEQNLFYSEQITSGSECLPYRVTLGDFMRFHAENGAEVDKYEGFAAGSYGPCRLGKYTIEQGRLLREIGFNLPIRTTVSNNAYRDLNLGSGFERLAWKGIVAADYMEKLLWRSRPYEKEQGSADKLFAIYIDKIVNRIRCKELFNDILMEANNEFKSCIDWNQPRKPLIGINGEIYLRSNKFSNSNLVKVCEDAGLEVVVSPMGEWLKYTSYRNLEDSITYRDFKKMVKSYIKKKVQEHDEHSIAINFKELIDDNEPSTADLLKLTSLHLSPKCGSEAVLSIGAGIGWLQNSKFSGVLSVMPHGCMPGGIVAAMSEKFSNLYQKPWISLTYDGFMETNNLTKINSFAEVIRFCARQNDS
ncbi:acyl-CoA dehydratase activase [Chloroflexota bacterium]